MVASVSPPSPRAERSRSASPAGPPCALVFSRLRADPASLATADRVVDRAGRHDPSPPRPMSKICRPRVRAPTGPCRLHHRILPSLSHRKPRIRVSGIGACSAASRPSRGCGLIERRSPALPQLAVAKTASPRLIGIDAGASNASRSAARRSLLYRRSTGPPVSRPSRNAGFASPHCTASDGERPAWLSCRSATSHRSDRELGPRRTDAVTIFAPPCDAASSYSRPTMITPGFLEDTVSAAGRRVMKWSPLRATGEQRIRRVASSDRVSFTARSRTRSAVARFESELRAATSRARPRAPGPATRVVRDGAVQSAVSTAAA